MNWRLTLKLVSEYKLQAIESLSVYTAKLLKTQLPLVNWIHQRPTKGDSYAGQAWSMIGSIDQDMAYVQESSVINIAIKTKISIFE
jgi:hypothetical protein